MEIKIACFSDTHCKHESVELPACDIAVFTGDFSHRGSAFETEHFLNWFSKQRHCVEKVMIAGNHDICFDPAFDKETKADKWLKDLKDEYPDIYYLENSSINLMGLNIWGSPVTPDFHPQYWGFNKTRGAEIKKIWDSIPTETDIVLTHGPCEFIGDYISHQNLYVGCKDLAYRIEEIQPKLHVCGHIHDGYSITEKGNTIYVNAAICNESYKPANKPHLITLTI